MQRNITNNLKWRLEKVDDGNNSRLGIVKLVRTVHFGVIRNGTLPRISTFVSHSENGKQTICNVHRVLKD